MGNYIKVSTNSISRDATRIEELKESIPTLMNELEASMQHLSTCWEGVAWANYQKSVAEHMEKLTEIYNYMSRYTINMQEAQKKYGRAEQDVCAEIRKVVTWF